MRTLDERRQAPGFNASSQQIRRPLRQYTGPPCSVIWRGGAAHVRVVGKGASGPEPHAHFAVQLSISLQGEVSFRAGPRAPRQSAPGWLIGSGQPHWIQSCGVSTTFFFDPLTVLGRQAASAVGDSGALALAPELCLSARDELERCWMLGWRGDDLQSLAVRLVAQLAPQHVTPDSIDPRVRAVIEALHTEVSENVSLDDLAAGVGLSESRLAHLFRQEVGIPIRQYRLSLRMEEAVTQIASGRSLTESAHAAGFADAAHFCRVCRRMFGSAPSGLPTFRLDRSLPGGPATG